VPALTLQIDPIFDVRTPEDMVTAAGSHLEAESRRAE
jgi:hypothetical protein